MHFKRFVSYIYQYEQGVRQKNAGFIKADIREGGCRMELQVRGLQFQGKIKIYLIVEHAGDDSGTSHALPEDGTRDGFGTSHALPENSADAVAVFGGEFAVNQGCGRTKLFFHQGLLADSGYTAEEITAVVLRYGSGKLLCSCWAKDVPQDVLRGKFQIWGDEKSKADNALPQTADSGAQTLSQDALPEETASPQHTEEPDTQITFRKIEITDIRSLPKRNWHLCSNSFLIHGFFNYHYLLLKTMERDGKKTCFLGVPGIFEQPERMMALLFGFPEFEPAQISERERSDGSGSSDGVFGYWMCRLES